MRILLVVCVVGLLAGCAPEPSSSPLPLATAPAGLATASLADPTGEPAGDTVSESRVSYNFALPSSPATVSHNIVQPFPFLVSVYVGNHPTESPAYQRISFYFRGGFPTYTFHYVPAVLSDGQGSPITLEGNTFLSVVFVNAQAHDGTGASTVVGSASPSIGFPNLRSYARAGDFEGHLSYGLGIQGPSAGTPVRAGELRRSAGPFYVVYFDFQSTLT